MMSSFVSSQKAATCCVVHKLHLKFHSQPLSIYVFLSFIVIFFVFAVSFSSVVSVLWSIFFPTFFDCEYSSWILCVEFAFYAASVPWIHESQSAPLCCLMNSSFHTTNCLWISFTAPESRWFLLLLFWFNEKYCTCFISLVTNVFMFLYHLFFPHVTNCSFLSDCVQGFLFFLTS